MKQRHSVIRGPVITEKASGMMERDGTYSFAVDRRANKIDVKRAVEAAFKVSVVKVNVLTARGKLKRVRWQTGKTPDWKKAMVTLKKGEKIDYTTA